jgi:hypothetical protein
MIQHTAPRYRGNRLGEVVDRLRRARADLKGAKQREGDAKAEIIAILNGRPQLLVGDTIVRAREVPSAPGSIVSANMIGSRIGGRRGFVVVELIGPGEDAEPDAAPAMGDAGSPQPRAVSS